MKKGKRAARFVDAINKAIKKVDKKMGKMVATFKCQNCRKKYIARSVADMYVCPLCGSVQHD